MPSEERAKLVTAYYNEIDPFAAQWLRKLKKLGIARVLCNLHDGWLYECPADTVVAATR